MKEDDGKVGAEVVFLLGQQRNLYHQLKTLTDRQMQIAETNSPESLVQIISGRRKLIAKLRQINEKLSLIKASWPKISIQIGAEHKNQARKIADEAQKILGQILKNSPPAVIENLKPNKAEQLDELFAPRRLLNLLPLRVRYPCSLRSRATTFLRLWSRKSSNMSYKNYPSCSIVYMLDA